MSRCDSEDMKGNQLPDEALIADVADGDTGALRELYDRHAPWLHTRLMRRCNDPEVVVDVLQDTFVALWKDARTFRGEGEVAGWLWGIAFRKMVSRRAPNASRTPISRVRQFTMYASVP